MSATTLRVSTQQMRKSVAGWLREEKATIATALALQSAIEAGAIAGSTYNGNRDADDEVFSTVTDSPQWKEETPSEPCSNGHECGCLIETLERIRDSRPSRRMRQATSEAFSLALFLGLGDTPRNSKWARAAARGIADYIAEVEAAR